MAGVDGSWDTVTKSPMGDQTAVLTITSSGDSFTGSYAGPMGNAEVKDGHVDGNHLTWKLDITVPMPMTLDWEATVDGDAINGTMTAGAFGSFAMTGKRA